MLTIHNKLQPYLKEKDTSSKILINVCRLIRRRYEKKQK